MVISPSEAFDKLDQASAEERAKFSTEVKAQVLGDEPSQHQKAPFQRTLILFFDGTSNEYSSRNTNVVRLFSCIQKEHPKQLVYYQTGVGTSSTTKFLLPGIASVSKIIDQGAALNLGEHVCGGYRFLQSNWKSGDKVCIFGFSRGAYTARALAGMLHAVGLLPPDMPEQVEFAYKVYTKLGSRGAQGDSGRNYKRDFCRDITVDFLGVWDTVASVGFLVPRTLPFSHSNGTTKVFRHAIALDERRVKFIPSLWRLSGVVIDPKKNPEWTIKKGAQVFIEPQASIIGNAIRWLRGVKNVIISSWWFTLFIPQWAHSILDRLGLCEEDHLEATRMVLVPTEKEPPDVKEVWFAGDHCDVGGGNEDDDKKGIKRENNIKYTPALANIPLRWMIREFYEADLIYDLNIRWHPHRLARYGIFLPEVKYTNDEPEDKPKGDPNNDHAPLRDGEVPRSRPSREYLDRAPKTIKLDNTDQDKEKPRRAKFSRSNLFPSGVMIDLNFHDRDVAAPHHDALWNWNAFGIMGMVLWWFLEFIPFASNVENKNTLLLEPKVGFNLFRPRDIPRETEPAQLDIHRLGKKWEGFFRMRSKSHFHTSVLERMEKHGYRPRPWHSDDRLSQKWVSTY